jgi:flagellar basal body-associated protein FliL
MKKEEPKITDQKIATPPAVPVATVEEKAPQMSRRTLALILLLVLVTIALLIVALLPAIKFPSTPKAPPPLTYAQTMLSLSIPTKLATNSYSTNVEISSGSNKTTAVQLELSYDPKVLTNVTVAPGTFFTSPVVLLKKIDTVNGRISYALGINPTQKAINGSGTVATITFSTLSGTTVIQTPINFGLKTAATAVGYAQSVLKQTTGVLFTLPSKVPTPTP